MSRSKDREWELHASVTNTLTWDQVHTAVLMDLRDELKKLNRVFECHNFVRIPRILDKIAENKPRRITKRKAAQVLARRRKKARP